jgi:DNA polymerase
MLDGLEAIYNELRRLQKEGVDRVYINDETHHLLKPVPVEAPARERGEAVEHENLAALLKKAPPPPEPEPAATPEVAAETLPNPPQLTLPEGDADTQLQWLKSQVIACSVCNEHRGTHEKVVPGDGSASAEILFCGDAPGTDEADQGVPFVGSAGQLLNKIIKAMGLERSNVYCTNIMKWRPKNDKPYGNRPPTQEEMTFCLPYFRAEVEAIQPKVIVALGNIAVNGLMGPAPDRKMGKIRGTWHEFQDVPLMITFHPSYLLRNDTLKTKRMVWEDLLAAMKKIGLPISEKQQGFFLEK